MGIATRIAARVPRELRPDAAIWETEHRLLHALGSARPPAAVQWMVTRACDLRCEHCYAEAGHKAHGELSTEEARSLVIDATADMGCPLLVLAGGELWLRRDIEGLIEHAVARGLEWAMHTHGGHIHKHRELLRRHPPALAAISLDGDHELHDRLRGKLGGHKAALEAVAILVEAGCREVVLGTTVTRHNADHIADMFDLVARSGAHSWGLHLVAPAGRAQLDLVPRPAQLRRLAAFARSRRARFPVELCNEWGSAGADDPFYRDRPFACGAGRISMVVGPTGEVMPCTTTDTRESEGNVRRTPLRLIWRDGFARFRGGGHGHDPAAADAAECWLQTRSGVRIAEASFGAAARPRPKLIDLVPPRLITLSRRALAPRAAQGGFASATTRHAVTAAAIGLAVLGACAMPRDPHEAPPRETDQPQPAAAIDTAPEAPTIARTWPSSLDERGLRGYGAWIEPLGHWRAQVVPSLVAWESGDSAPDVGPLVRRSELDTPSIQSFEQELARYVARGLGRSSLDQLQHLLDAAERAALFDAAFAAHLWRVAERLPGELRARAQLYGRLARHHRVVAALIVTAATLGPISQRAWLKKSAPPPGWSALELPDGFEAAARAQLAATQIGPWDQVGITASFNTPALRYREGARERLTPGRDHHLGRLDVLYCPTATRVRLRDQLTVELPAGAVVTHAALAAALTPPQRAELDVHIDRALAGDTEALDQLEPLLPLLRARLHERLTDKPDAPGAPALRTLLVSYDE